MMIHHARRRARFAGDDHVLLDDQDRSLWDMREIEAGRQALDQAIALDDRADQPRRIRYRSMESWRRRDRRQGVDRPRDRGRPSDVTQPGHTETNEGLKCQLPK
jgi:predicted RNA polymerase sigma factor